MQSDFTLVVPTYNRPKQLAKLLSYLAREQASFPIFVLDSSHPEHRIENQRIVTTSGLSISYKEYDQTIKPFDKFYDGVSQVPTEFCQLCADDDLILVKELGLCVEQLKLHPKASVVHGYYFTFLEDEIPGGMDISQILYYSNTIDAEQPLLRLRNLFKQYQALTYGVYRTAILKRILHTIKNVDRILARELLASALAVVYGHAIRLPLFTHGRSQGASESYQYWHPLEWLMKTPQGLFNDYQRYQKILVTETINAADNGVLLKEEVERKIDLIHLSYLLRHAPKDSYEFLMDKIMQDKGVDDVWPALEVQLPLIHAAHAEASDREASESTRLNTQKISASVSELIQNNPAIAVGAKCSAIRWLKSFIAKLFKNNSILGKMVEPPSMKKMVTEVRTYRLHPNFLVPKLEGIRVTTEDITRLTKALDNYY